MKTAARIAIWLTVTLSAFVMLWSCASLTALRSHSASSAGLSGQRPSAAEPGILPAPNEELWVIQKPSSATTGTVPLTIDKDNPGSGLLLAKLADEEQEVPVPLKHTDVQASIAGYIAAVDVTQEYHNPYGEKIEAVYVFPLPQNAAVSEFIMTIGERRIRGIIREREEAERTYAEAKRQGYTASLMTQERPNIFTQKVANIEPGKQIDIDVKYFHTLAYVDGWYEFVFPMVVGPRFNPPGSTAGVGALSRGTPGRSGQQTEVQYLKPGERSGHDIALSVSIDAGVPIEALESQSHVVAWKKATPQTADVQLTALDAIPNKDFVLRYKVAGDHVKSALVTHRDERGGFFTLMVYPPEGLQTLQRAPMEMIFVLDCSGSMSGKPIEQAKTAVSRALKHLQPDDTFQIIRFSNNASQLGSEPLAATAKNVRQGLRYVDSLHGGGGTMMIEGIKAALDFPHDPRRLRFVAFLTDGYIGNEAQILGEMRQRLGESRIFSFGVGSSPNRYLMDRMARLGKGAVAYVGLNQDAGPVMDRFFERVSRPALANLTVDWGRMDVTDVFPATIPDLFVGRPVVLTGRFSGQPDAIRLTGHVGDETRGIVVPGAQTTEHSALPLVWARMKIADLANRTLYETDGDWPEQIRQVALEYGLMSAYTAFVTVDSLTRTAGDHGTTVAVPVPVPEGVRYETTVSDGEGRGCGADPGS